jgi:hypothetical protein
MIAVARLPTEPQEDGFDPLLPGAIAATKTGSSNHVPEERKHYASQ